MNGPQGSFTAHILDDKKQNVYTVTETTMRLLNSVFLNSVIIYKQTITVKTVNTIHAHRGFSWYKAYFRNHGIGECSILG